MNNKIFILTLAAAAACGGKKTTAGAADGGASAGGGAGGGGTTAQNPTPEVKTAAGGEVTGLKPVNDCPKSLAGVEEVDRTLKKECGPIPVTDTYTVAGKLTLEAGVVLKFAAGTELVVGYDKTSKLVVKGTAADPVKMVSAGDAVPGFWRGIRLHGQASRSQIEGLVIEHAGGDDHGAIWINAAQEIVLKGSTIRSSKESGVRLDNDGTLAELSGNTFEKAGTFPLSLTAPAVAGIGAGNKFDEGAQIEVRGGRVEKNARWQPGAPLLFTDTAAIDGKAGKATLEIAPGTELRFAEGIELSVGYNSAGGLVCTAPADKPVVFTSGGDKAAGAWKGVFVYHNGDAKLDGVSIDFAGNDEDKAAIWVADGGSLELRHAKIATNTTGLRTEPGAKVVAVDDNTFTGNTKAAVSMPAAHVAKLGPANKLEKERIEIRGGDVKESGTWNAFGATVEVTEAISIGDKATLTLVPGLDLAFKSGVELSVGYAENASLKAVGAADKPIRLHAVDDGSHWTGIVLYSNARDVDLQHLVLENVDGAAGVQARGEATGKVASVTCKKCTQAAFTRECNAKVTAADVKGEDGTPTGEKKQEGCE